MFKAGFSANNGGRRAKKRDSRPPPLSRLRLGAPQDLIFKRPRGGASPFQNAMTGFPGQNPNCHDGGQLHLCPATVISAEKVVGHNDHLQPFRSLPFSSEEYSGYNDMPASGLCPTTFSVEITAAGQRCSCFHRGSLGFTPGSQSSRSGRDLPHPLDVESQILRSPQPHPSVRWWLGVPGFSPLIYQR